jgi:cytochrome b561
MNTFDEATPASAYTPIARFLHWLTAALVLTMLPIGLIMANFALGPTGDTLYDIHRSIGALLMPIVVVRLFYRLKNSPTPLPADIPVVQRRAAAAVHWALYILLIVQPIVGWIATSSYRAPMTMFWLFQLPPIWPIDRALSESLFGVHRLLGLAIAALLCAHIGAALFHRFVRKDEVLLRMIGR